MIFSPVSESTCLKQILSLIQLTCFAIRAYVHLGFILNNGLGKFIESAQSVHVLISEVSITLCHVKLEKR